MRLILTKEQQALLETGTKINTGNGTAYYFLPYWWQKKYDGEFIAHHLEKIPGELQEVLLQHRKEPNKILYQIIDFGNTELWHFYSTTSEEQIRAYWKEYQLWTEAQDDAGDFEEFMSLTYPDVYCEREFVNEITV
jgi:hypothetical protein